MSFTKSSQAPPAGLDIAVSSPFTSAYDNYINVGIKSINGKLRVRIISGSGYRRAGSLLALVEGSASSYHDTDSAQAAIKWTKDKQGQQPCKDPVASNARPQSPTRVKAANWTRGAKTRSGDGKLVEEVNWDAAVPSDARHVEVVLVFTDLLVDTFREHDDRTDHGRRRGDVPAVIGSWSGDLVNGTWTFRINRADLTKDNHNAAGKKDYPTQSQIDKLVVEAQHVVKARTDCTLKQRDFNSAGSDKLKWDTGFDIVLP